MGKGGLQLVEAVKAARSLLGRLAERAAYAGDDEYREIRSLMSALRGFADAAEAP